MPGLGYPLVFGAGGTVQVNDDITDKLRLLFDTAPGQRLNYPDYGVSFEALAQNTSEFEDMLPFVLIQARTTIEKYIPEIRLIWLSGERDKKSRSLVIQVVYERIEDSTREVWSWEQEGVLNV